MNDLFKKIYGKAEEFQGKRLAILLIAVFLVFSLLGLGVGLLLSLPLDGDKTATIPPENPTVIDETYFEGKITYLDPNLYPLDEISYLLVDKDGSELLLKARDQKLMVAEGHFAKVYGSMSKTVDNKEDVLIVEKIVIRNVPN